ncbi:MAG TPA: Crp/Fnr family transcriptional regulator [Pyrinomonadaceae bacterium]|nr:Crp/Fnr family transcriptional regulator [Pyrinomonadaceae bacterium]
MNSSTQSPILDHPELLRSGITSRNELLRELFTVPAVARELLPELKVVSLTVNQVLYEQGDKMEVVYFPLDSVTSGLAIMEDGTTMETSMTGREGLVGISSLLGSGCSRQWVWVTVGGSAIQLESRFIEKTLLEGEVALKAMLKAYRLLITQLSQRSVCNSRHTIMERLCCWLLMIHDRVGGSNLSLTQEMIASRVGARRAGITVAAGILQSMKAIGYRRGQLHIQDRPVLERTVCECYNLMRGDLESPPPDYSAFSL